MIKHIQVLIISVCVVFGVAVKLPDYIQPCSRSAPDFDKCCLEHAIATIPKIIHGDKSLGIPNMSPLKLPKVEIKQSGFQFVGKDMDIVGLETIQVKELRFDLKNKKGYFTGYLPYVIMTGLYEIAGKILLLKIEGTGPCNITIEGGNYQYTFDFDYEDVQGVKYIKHIDNNLIGKEKRIYFKFDNLFNGDQTLVEPIRRLVNDDWEAIAELFRPAIYDFIKQLIASVTNSFFKKVPEKELFLP